MTTLQNICALNEQVDEWQVLTRQPLTGRALWLHGQPKAWARPLVWAVRRWLRMDGSDKEALGLLGGMVAFIAGVVVMLAVFG